MNGATLGVSQQQTPKAPALLLRRDRDILDPQMIGSQDRLDEAGKRAIDNEKINRVLDDRPLIVGLHGQRLTPDQRDPLGVGCARQAADRISIGRDGRTDFCTGTGRFHRDDYCQRGGAGKVARRRRS